jgi:hypothetical protein
MRFAKGWRYLPDGVLGEFRSPSSLQQSESIKPRLRRQTTSKVELEAAVGNGC